ncbi:MAG: hypothetical protein FD124_3693, partial [Alphaproteobacteria bacterium]
MLREKTTLRAVAIGAAVCAGVGAICASLVLLGNPGNMGICGACFLRDIAGAVGFIQTGKGPACFRPEVAGVMLGALGLALLRRNFTARSGSHAVTRFVFGIWMAIAALVFLGCPFRLLQRLGGGDLNAWIALPGFVAGVAAAMLFERNGYHIGATQKSPAPVGILGPLAVVAVGAIYMKGGLLLGPGPNAEPGTPPPHAPWVWALVLAVLGGAALSASGFCVINAVRQLFQRGKKAMLISTVALVAAYAVVLLVAGKLNVSVDGQPIAHSDHVASAL